MRVKSGLCPYLRLKPSPILGYCLVAIHLLAFAAAWLNPLPIFLRTILSATVSLGLWLSLSLHNKGDGIIGLALLPDGTWRLSLATGIEVSDAHLLGSSLLTPWFVLLHLRIEKSTVTLLICRDSLGTEEFRSLRVALKVITLEDQKRLALR